MNGTEYYISVVLFIVLYKLVMSSASVDRIQKFVSIESLWAVCFCGLFII